MQHQNVLPIPFDQWRLVHRCRKWKSLGKISACLALLSAQLPAARADARYDWEALLNTRRIAVVAPFFCTVPLPALPPSAKPSVKRTAHVVFPIPKSAPAARSGGTASYKRGKSFPALPGVSAKPPMQPARIQIDPVPQSSKSGPAIPVTATDTSFHARTLQTLTETLRAALPESIGNGHTYQVIPETDVQTGLRKLRWQTRDLFQGRGLPAKSKFPDPDIKHIQKLAQILHVDGVVVASMREPASIGDGLRLPYELWLVNPFNLSTRRVRAHVLSPRVQAFLITSQGVTAWQDEQAADHPRATPRTLKTLLIDWEEATEQVAQQLADSLHRQPPG